MLSLDPVTLFFLIITYLGSAVFFIVSFPVAFYYRKKEGLRLILVVLIAIYFANLFKIIFKVPRPPREYWVTSASGYSFPSGHATDSAAYWGYIGLLSWRKNKIFTVLSFVLIILIGVSRVILGVHTWIDVIAGWILGTIFAIVGYTYGERISEFYNNLETVKRLIMILVLYGVGLMVSYVLAVGDTVAMASFNDILVSITTVASGLIMLEVNRHIGFDWSNVTRLSKLVSVSILAILLLLGPFMLIKTGKLIYSLIGSILIGIILITITPLLASRMNLIEKVD